MDIRKFFITALLALGMQGSASAQLIAGVNVASEWTQLANLAQLQGMLTIDTEQLIKQSLTLAEAIKTAKAMAKNLEKGDLSFLSGELKTLAKRQSKLIAKGFQISDTMAAADKDFQSVLKNPGAIKEVGDFAKSFSGWTDGAHAKLKAATAAAGLAKETVIENEQALAAAVEQMAAADGNLKALQALGTINAEGVKQVQQLQTLLADQNQAINAALAAKETKSQAIQDATTIRFEPGEKVTPSGFKTPKF